MSEMQSRVYHRLFASAKAGAYVVPLSDCRCFGI
jgi:hypothetical protein